MRMIFEREGPAPRSAGQAQARARRSAGMGPRRPLFRHRRAGTEGRPRASRARCGGVREPLEGHARGRSGEGRGRPARRSAARLRGAGGADRPHRLLCRPGLCRRHVGPAARQALWRHPGEDDRRQRASAVLRAGTEPDRRRADRQGARCRSGCSATTGPGCSISGWTSPTSSRIASSSCSTKSRSPGAAPGTGSSTRR